MHRYVLLSAAAALVAVITAQSHQANAAGTKYATVQQRPPRIPSLNHGWIHPRNRQVTEQIDADEPSLAKQGAALTEWGPDPKTGKLIVYLTHYTPAAAALIVHKYGSNDVTVARHSRPLPHRYGRQTDRSPFYGGDRIKVPGGHCTSAFAVVGVKSGKRYMLTAGHCAKKGTIITTNGHTMGKVINRRFCDYCIDSEATNGSYRPIIWGGGPNGNSTYVLGGAHFPKKGTHVTMDGSYTGEITKANVTGFNRTVKFSDGVHTRYLSEVRKGGTRLCHGGDSGGPVFQRLPDHFVRVAGTIVGGNGTGTTCYYQQITSIENWFNVWVEDFRPGP